MWGESSAWRVDQDLAGVPHGLKVATEDGGRTDALGNVNSLCKGTEAGQRLGGFGRSC